MHKAPFDAKISEHVWRTKYRWFEDGHTAEPSIEATWDRVALAVSGAEAHHHNEWRERFRAILSDFRFLPGGRILAGAGTSRRDTLFNCFVMGPIEDSIQGIFTFNTMRCVRRGDGQAVTFDVEDAAWHHYKALHGQQASLPAHFVQAVDVSAEDQLRIMATVQSCVDIAISKTVRLPQSANAQEIGLVLRRAWEFGLKGCAVYRAGGSGGD